MARRRWDVRFLSILLVGALGVMCLSRGGASSARADAPEVPDSCAAATDARLPVATLPGTPGEARDYERREAQSPQVQEFAGGDVVIGVSVFALVLIILIIVLLND
jgi:hypothetical protein